MLLILAILKKRKQVLVENLISLSNLDGVRYQKSKFALAPELWKMLIGNLIVEVYSLSSLILGKRKDSIFDLK